MLSDLIDILWSAKISGNENEIEQAYKNLENIGINRTSADIVLKEYHPDGRG